MRTKKCIFPSLIDSAYKKDSKYQTIVWKIILDSNPNHVIRTYGCSFSPDFMQFDLTRDTGSFIQWVNFGQPSDKHLKDSEEICYDNVTSWYDLI